MLSIHETMNDIAKIFHWLTIEFIHCTTYIATYRVLLHMLLILGYISKHLPLLGHKVTRTCFFHFMRVTNKFSTCTNSIQTL